MKKILTMILCCTLIFSISACSSDNSDNTETSVPSTTTNVGTTKSTQVVDETISDEVIEKIEKKLDDFEGIVYLTKNGSLVYSHAKGKDESGADLTVESPMYIGSISKQFCATAIMMLKEQGKLSIDDTLDKYFPEYEIGKDITIENLLTMRSGITEMMKCQELSTEKSVSENMDIIKEWLFEQPLDFEPNSKWFYSNSNYFLLGNIIEIVSEKSYYDFIKENIFEPLEMEHSGFTNELKHNDFFSSRLPYLFEDDIFGKGAGGIVSTAPDMDKWMTGLVSGKIITEESYQDMITDHSPDMASIYGYGLKGMHKKGRGHTGGIGKYISVNYFNEEYGYNLFAATTSSYNEIGELPSFFIDLLIY